MSISWWKVIFENFRLQILSADYIFHFSWQMEIHIMKCIRILVRGLLWAKHSMNIFMFAGSKPASLFFSVLHSPTKPILTRMSTKQMNNSFCTSTLKWEEAWERASNREECWQVQKCLMDKHHLLNIDQPDMEVISEEKCNHGLHTSSLETVAEYSIQKTCMKSHIWGIN